MVAITSPPSKNYNKLETKTQGGTVTSKINAAIKSLLPNTSSSKCKCPAMVKGSTVRKDQIIQTWKAWRPPAARPASIFSEAGTTMALMAAIVPTEWGPKGETVRCLPHLTKWAKWLGKTTVVTSKNLPLTNTKPTKITNSNSNKWEINP
jgi:hypothetical protein